MTAVSSALLDAMVRHGGVTADYHGRTLVRDFGDPEGEYRAATEALAVFDRSHRTRLLVSGRSPGAMLKGVITGVMPPAPREAGEGVLAGRTTYHAVLTPKGKMITDLWATVLGADAAADYLLDVPVAGAGGLREAFTRLLPPRFAAVRDISAETAALTLVGPEAAVALARRALEARVDAGELRALEEGEWRAVCPAGQRPADALLVIRTAEVWPEAWTVTGPAEPVVRLWEELVSEEGARPAGLGVWSTLRVEAGRPVFGTDMDDTTIPTEAGIDARAIDHRKGCYTGQEVIVRIRDRGHVNRYLRRLELGDVPAPATGTELLAADGSGKVVGRVTSAVRSPRFGGALALAYVARGAREVLLDGRRVAVPDSA